MRQFLKFTLAAFMGCAIFFISLALLATIVITAIMVSSSTDTLEVKDKSVLVVNLSGDIVEHKTENAFSALMNDNAIQQGLDDIVGAIDKAADSKEIKAIYIEAGIINTDYASLQEIRQALERAKAKKKIIVSYAKEYTQGAYYVCSVADKVWINPSGMLDIHGLTAQPMYVKDLLAKFGVKMTVVKVGKFKSATEEYTEEKMSEANRKQVTRYINGIWEEVAGTIAKSRGISKAEVNLCADNMAAMQNIAYLQKHKLIDKTLYAEDVKTEIKKLLGISNDKAIDQITCSTLNNSTFGEKTDNKKIAIYYCEGSIARTPETGILNGGESGIISPTVVKDLETLANDDDVKAVVLRVNSGGGDAFASEEIWHAIKTLKEKKPVVVSMGGAAASGAYYMSCVSSYIMAQPTTLTGSIGIFGVFPDASNLMTQKLGIKFDNVKTNAHSDFTFAQTMRPFNAEEVALLQQYIDNGYELFCKRVAEGRRIPINKVKEIAEGRVWLGMDAVKIGLVDGIGGINSAIAKAAQLAKIKTYETITYPEPSDWLTQLTETVSGNGNNLDEQLRNTLGAYYESFVMVRNIQQQNPIQARCPIVLTVK